MKKLNYVVSIAIVGTLFLGSCGTTKYQDKGFGGGDFKSFKSSSKNHESLPATRAIEWQNAKIDLQEPIENNKIQINNSDKPKIFFKILSKTQSNVSKPTGNYISDKINHVKAKVLQKVTKKISDSKWPNSDSSFGKWLLTIISLSIGIFGFIIVLMGIAEGTGAYSFGLLIAGIGLAIMFIGYLFLIWARNVQ